MKIDDTNLLEALKHTPPDPLAAKGRSDALVASTLQKVIETDGVLLTDKDHLDEALRAATYVVKGDPYQGYILKDRIFKAAFGRPSEKIGNSATAELFAML